MAEIIWFKQELQNKRLLCWFIFKGMVNQIIQDVNGVVIYGGKDFCAVCVSTNIFVDLDHTFELWRRRAIRL